MSEENSIPQGQGGDFDLSVIIDVHHHPEGAQNILSLLFAVMSGEGAPRTEILVVDAEAGEPRHQALQSTIVQAQETAHTCRGLKGPDAGQALVRNLGAKEARGRYLVFVSDAQMIGPSWLLRIWDEIRKNPDTSGSQAMVFYGGSSVQAVHSAFTSSDANPFLGQPEYVRVPFQNASLACPRQYFERLGGFDPKLPDWGAAWDFVCRSQNEVMIAHVPGWDLKKPEVLVSPRYFEWQRARVLGPQILWMAAKYQENRDVLQQMVRLFGKSDVFSGIRILLFAIPMMVETDGVRAMCIGVCLNLVLDSIRLIRHQVGLLTLKAPDTPHEALRREITPREAVFYLLLNWTEDLRKAMMKLTVRWLHLLEKSPVPVVFQTRPTAES